MTPTVDPDPDDAAWYLPLTREEYEAIGEGAEIEFGIDGGLIEQDPTFVVTLRDPDDPDPEPDGEVA